MQTSRPDWVRGENKMRVVIIVRLVIGPRWILAAAVLQIDDAAHR